MISGHRSGDGALGDTLAGLAGTLSVYRRQECRAYSDFNFLASPRDRGQMIVTSPISPGLKSGLRFIGVWPDMPYAIVHRLLYLSSILIMQYFQYLYVFAHCKFDELQELVDGLPAALDYSLTIIKLMTLWTNNG